MMPFFLPLLVGALLVGGVVAVIFWERVLGWAEQNITPWVATNFPSLLPYLREAYVGIDRAVVGTRRAAKKAWQQVRQVLLKQFVEYSKLPSGHWLVQIITWVAGPGQRKRAMKITGEKSVPFEELPEEVRDEMERRGKTSHRVDLTKLRDAQLLTNED